MQTASRRSLSVLFLLLVYVYVRLHNLISFPFFIDESVYMHRAQLVRDGNILRPAHHSRVLHAWYTAFLGPDVPQVGWLSRVAIVTLGLLGAAALYGLVRSFVSHRAGLVALLLWIATPYALFYERMGLADSALSALAVVVVWIAWQMMRTPRYWLAVALGLGLVGLMLAKASGTSWLPLPLVALVLAADITWRRRIVLGALAYGTFGALWGSFMIVLRSRGVNYFGVAERFVGGVDDSLTDRIWHNIASVLEFDTAYLGIPVIILAVLGALYWLRQNPRAALFGIAALGMSGGATILFGRNVNSRYAFSHAVWVVMFCSIGIGLLIEKYPRWQSVVYLALVLWIGVFFAPFAHDMWSAPEDLSLAGNDVNEYITRESSGFGVREMGEMLSETPESLPVLGIVSNCYALRIAAHPLDVDCPEIAWNTMNQNLMRQAEQWAENEPIYVVGESLLYIDLDRLPHPNEIVTTIERPDEGVAVHLIRIEQGARLPEATH